MRTSPVQLTKVKIITSFSTLCKRQRKLNDVVDIYLVDIFIGGKFSLINPNTGETEHIDTNIENKKEYLKCFIDMDSNQIKYKRLTWDEDFREVKVIDTLKVVNLSRDTVYFFGFLEHITRFKPLSYYGN